MLKRILRIALKPFMLIARIMLGLAAFITSIASSIMALALLASPIGLPAIANFLLNRMDHILGFFEGLLC